MKVIVIDDEAHARNILKHYLHMIPDIKLIGEYDNCISCFEAHDLNEVDLILLDINLPEVSGLQFARTISKYKARVILTTAYSEYAIKGYQLDVVDYLLKPIEFEFFLAAIEKAREVIDVKNNYNANQPLQTGMQQISRGDNYVFIKSDYKIVKVFYDEILYIEAMQEYVRIYLSKGKQIISLQSLKKLEEILPSPPFFRIHRSHTININALEALHQRNIIIGGKELHIGKTYWDELYSYISAKTIF